MRYSATAVLRTDFNTCLSWIFLGESSPPVTLTNASLVMTAQGQVLTFKSPLMPGQIAALPSTFLQAELKSEVDSSNGTTQPGEATLDFSLIVKADFA